MNKRLQKGFTLVELAIVLVIVGLLLGGVLKGQELIFNSKVKATFNLGKQLSAAASGYQDRYKQLPGDDPNALVRFPTFTPAVVNGNGNGLVAWGGTCAPGQQGGENCQGLAHLRASGFLSGTGAYGVSTPFGSVASIESSQGFSFGNGGASLLLTFERQTFTHKSASAFDTSFDDGRPNAGAFQCRTIGTYDLATPDIQMPDACATAL